MPDADHGRNAIAVLEANFDGKVSLNDFHAFAIKRFDLGENNHPGVASASSCVRKNKSRCARSGRRRWTINGCNLEMPLKKTST